MPNTRALMLAASMLCACGGDSAPPDAAVDLAPPECASITKGRDHPDGPCEQGQACGHAAPEGWSCVCNSYATWACTFVGAPLDLRARD